MTITLFDTLAIYGALMALINIVVTNHCWKATRPRLVIKLRGELVDDYTRLKGKDAPERTLVIRGTLTPMNFRTTIQQLALHVDPLAHPEEYGIPTYHPVGKTLESGVPYHVDWPCRASVCNALDATMRPKHKLRVSVYQAGEDTPLTVRVPVKNIVKK